MNLVNAVQDVAFLSETCSEEIRRGAFVILLDKGHFYYSHQGTTRCFSEHGSALPVYDIVGAPGTILVGLTEHGHSWVQWERSACWTPQHLCDWWRYWWSSKNQGPFGDSEHTDRNPIRIQTWNEINF
jgi:hypothetical protein